MYVYLYDTFISEAKFQNTIARVETRLTDLGIAGKICRLSVLTSIEELVNDAVKNGAETIVAVGNDETVSKVIPLIADHKVSFGIIPIGKPSRLAQLLGIPEGDKACDVLSARVVTKLDLGKANQHYFLSRLEIPAGEYEIQLNGQYTARSLNPNQTITIYNFDSLAPGVVADRSNPRDGQLELIFSGGESAGLGRFFNKDSATESVFPIKKAQIQGLNQDQSVIADGYTIINTPVNVGVARSRLKMIVGKSRGF
ncbi:hypothetical protein KKG41_03745 [Patescibacteria group bacterium]|nr:hypothetical protein [Patescibacteria group bacterium]MBU1890277.1 hypothetical protein [Patescibacteria group bacterium]